MTTDQPSLLNAAKQGNPTAIAALINRSLTSKGITTKVARNHHTLSVLLEAIQTPNQEQVFPFIYKGITSLGITSIQAVKVYGRQTGSDMPEWEQEFNVPGYVASESASIVVRPHVSVVQPTAPVRKPTKSAAPRPKPQQPPVKLIALSSIAAVSLLGIIGISASVFSSRSAQANVVKHAETVLNGIPAIAPHTALTELKADQKLLQDNQQKLQEALNQLKTAPKSFAFNLNTIDTTQAKLQTQLTTLEQTSQTLNQQVQGLEQLLPFVQSTADQFSAVDSSLDVGMNYREYGQQVRELKIVLDRLNRKPGATENTAYQALTLAFKEYDFAHDVWKYYMESDETHSFISTASPYGVTLMSEYGVEATKIGDNTYIYLDTALSKIWQRASQHVETAQKVD